MTSAVFVSLHIHFTYGAGATEVSDELPNFKRIPTSLIIEMQITRLNFILIQLCFDGKLNAQVDIAMNRTHRAIKLFPCLTICR